MRFNLARPLPLGATALLFALSGASCERQGSSPSDEAAISIPASAAPLEGTLVFQSDREGNWDIFRIEADGSRLERLTRDPADDLNPSWSPDGESLVFSSDRTGAGDIYIMNADGSDVRQLTDHDAYEGAPQFTPDGRFVVFEGERDGRAEIYRVEVASRRVDRLTESRTRKLGPTYSPDGAMLAFMEKGLIWWQVTARDETTGTSTAVSVGGGSCRPAWSPAGQLLAYVSTKDADKADVWLREMSGGREGTAWRVSTRPNAHNYDPSFSPDGMWLAIASTIDRGGNEQWDLFITDVNGKRLRRLTGDEGNERFPQWRPDISGESS